MTLSRIDGVPRIRGSTLDNLAEAFGTPLHLFRPDDCVNCHAFEHAFRAWPLICYAVANANLSVLQASSRIGFDIVSGGELAVKRAGSSTKHVVFSGVGKTRWNSRALIEGIHCFNVESEAELSLLAGIF